VVTERLICADNGYDYYEHPGREAIERRAIHQLELLGYEVSLNKKPAA